MSCRVTGHIDSHRPRRFTQGGRYADQPRIFHDTAQREDYRQHRYGDDDSSTSQYADEESPQIAVMLQFPDFFTEVDNSYCHEYRGNDAEMLALVNAWRASRGRAAIPASALMTDAFQKIDLRLSKKVNLGGARSAEVILQVFNLLGTDNFGNGATPWQMNALSNAFGTLGTVYPRQQAELAVRFVW